MEALNLQTHGIAVYPNRKRLFWVTSLMVLLLLPILGMDVFAIWAFWNHIWAFWHQYHIDTGAYVAATMLSIGTFFVGWGMFVALYRLCRRSPAIIINSQGFYTDFPLHFTFLPRSRQSFIPWEEIEWISSFQLFPGVMYTWLSLSLKDPAHYWSLYGNGTFRKWRRDSLTGAHINIVQYPLSLSTRQILQRIEENYSPELLKYEVKIIH